ncbi:MULTISPECIES: RICIN domain-containing protein [unclassified Streptomyces]
MRSGKCLEVAGASTANGAALDQAACTAGANQQWMVV